MEVTLTSELEAFIQEKVRSGRYLDASEVVRDALRALEERGDYVSAELETWLLEGVRGPHTPYTPETLEEIRGLARARHGSLH
jgi:antitoxin ParD1/3/4